MTRKIHLTPESAAESAAESDARRQREWDLVTAPMVVSCFHCGAGVGRWCRSARHQNSAVNFHAARLAAVAGWSEDDVVTAQERIREDMRALRDAALNARKEAS